jgi:hypothetical protein
MLVVAGWVPLLLFVGIEELFSHALSFITFRFRPFAHTRWEQWILRVVVDNTPRPISSDSTAVIERQRIQVRPRVAAAKCWTTN